jgi:hypothetical protein
MKNRESSCLLVKIIKQLSTLFRKSQACGRCGILGILILLKVPIMSIMPYCVIKNGVLIFREKTLKDGFLRTFEEG